MKYYPINLVQQKLYANENVFIIFIWLIILIKLLFRYKRGFTNINKSANMHIVKMLRPLQLGSVWSA